MSVVNWMMMMKMVLTEEVRLLATALVVQDFVRSSICLEMSV
jgi:hypothetical protein